MPQDSLKSFVYRSFVTCDDPSGVVECKTIRKSKTVTRRMEGKVENVKLQKNLITSSLRKEEKKKVSSKGLIDEVDRPSSVQLREVSKGVQNLSKVVDSLPRGSFDRPSENIAKDLLRGALSLQESLLMLGKLQEASEYMANFKKKQKEKGGGGKNDRNSLQRSYSERFGGGQNNVMELQKARLSADGSSRDCYKELREVIRESFARQNLLPKSISEEKACSDRKLDFSSDIASASSSQSSLFNSHDFASSDSSLSNLQAEKPKGSNLIAKLMGLEEFPFKPVQSTPWKHLENGRLLNSKRPIFDIDLPNGRKPSFIVQKEKPEQRTLGEIIEIMRFKGLIRNESFDGSKRKMHHSDVSYFADDTPPIVLMKPLHTSTLEKELPCMNKCTCGRKASNNEEMLKLWKIKEGVPLKRIDPQAPLNSAEIQRKVRADTHAVKKLGQKKGTKYFGEATARPSDKESRVQDHLSSTRSKASVPVNFKLQKGEAIEKRVDKIQRVAPSKKKAVEKNQIAEPNLRRSIVSKPNNQGKIHSTKVSNSRGSTVLKNQVAAQKSITSNPTSKSRTATMLPNSGNRKKNVKSDKLAYKQSAVVVENIGPQNVDAEINLKFENKDNMTETRISPSELLPCEEVRHASDFCTKDDSNTPFESTAMIIHQNHDLICKQSDYTCADSNSIRNESQMTRASVRDILLSSVNFINRAEELFDTTSGQPMLLEETSLQDYGMGDAKLIVDCANELVECKFQQWGLTAYPLLQHPIMRSKVSISFDHLVGRICDGIERLKTYSKLCGETLLIDTLYSMLKKDLWCKGVVTGAWVLGWENGFTFDEVEQVVFDVEEQLLSGIIEDWLLDFSL